MKKYWMIHNLSRAGSGYRTDPVVEHDTLIKAQAEAARLAMKQPNDKFVILEAVFTVYCQMPPVMIDPIVKATP